MSTCIIGWLPNAHALFIPVKGGDIVMSFQGLEAVERPVGVVTLCAQSGPQRAQYIPGVRTMGYKRSRSTGKTTYKFGHVYPGLDPYSEHYGFHVTMSYFGIPAPVAREDAFDHDYYFLNNAPPAMAMLIPVGIRD